MTLPKTLMLSLLLSCPSIETFAQPAGGGPVVNRIVFQTETIGSVTAVTEVFGRGQCIRGERPNHPLCQDCGWTGYRRA